MKSTIKLSLAALSLFSFVAFGTGLSAQTPPETFVKGTLNIQFDTRTQPGPGVVDTYTFNVNVSNSAKFVGTIKQTPFLKGSWTSSDQVGHLDYDLKADVVNPRNPAQTRNVGKVYGTVPVSRTNVYDFENGTLKTQVFATGRAPGFDSKFGGQAFGKPPTPEDSILAKMKKEALSFTKSVNGHAMTIAVTKYDVMKFQNHVLAAGPVPIYGEVTVSGIMVYDYDRSSWYFQHLNVQYWSNGTLVQDVLSGDIRWVEDDNRKVNGIGEYDFDLRINEPPPSEGAAFAPTTDESAFFATDTSVQGLSGTMKYKDAMISNGTDVSASVVDIDLHGTKLTKQQAMYLCKLLLFSTVVPLNAE